MENPIILSINRKGKFTVEPSQFDDFQCGMNDRKEYTYEVSIEADDLCLCAPEYFVLDNMLVKEYFETTYMEKKAKCQSCELIACNAIKHFRELLKEKHPNVRVNKITVIISGSEHSFIKGEWVNPIY